MRIVLASSSPSRKTILESAGIHPHIHPAHIDESALLARLDGYSPAATVGALAQEKAQAVAPLYPDDCVIGCDSMLLIDGILQGKPHTIEETITRWKNQSGKHAQLLTGHYMVTPRGIYQKTSTTDIYFGVVQHDDIVAYAHSEEPLFCAGAFTLEARGGWFIDRIDGDPSSVIGLSLPVVRQGLYQLGYTVAQLWG